MQSNEQTLEGLLSTLKTNGEAPLSMTLEAFSTLQGCLYKKHTGVKETPFEMYDRVARAAAIIYDGHDSLSFQDLYDDFFHVISNNWLGLSTPMAANFGTPAASLNISCLETGTLIHSRDGYKKIEDLEIGDEVLTHLGNWKPVLAKKSRQTSGDLYKLSIQGRTKYPLYITGNHQVLTNNGWKRVDELNTDKIITEPLTHAFRPRTRKALDFKLGSERYSKGSSLLNNEVNKGSCRVKILPNATLNQDLAWFFGLWFAEGHTNDNGTIGISMGHHEIETLNKWGEIAKKYFNLDYTMRSGFNHRGHQFATCYIYNKYLQLYFDSQFGKGCKEKLLPYWILDAEDVLIRAFWNGFITGDAHIKNKIEYDNVMIGLSNEKLIYQLFYIASVLGLSPSLGKQSTFLQSTQKRYDSYLLSTPLNKKLEPLASNYILEKEQRETTVWDIEVADDHSFVAQGVVVHNCFVLSVSDSINGIFDSLHEASMLTKAGGGVGIDLTSIRPQGNSINGGGNSNGAKPWSTIFDIASGIVSQAGVRRGQFSFNIDIESPDLWDFLLAKDHSKGDPRKHIHSNICVNVTDEFMSKLYSNDSEAINIWNAVLRTRLISGSPYLHFIDNANRDLVQCMKDEGFKITGTNICTEISSCSTPDYTMVCCLASENLYLYDDWKHWVGKTGLNLHRLSIFFLDAAMQYFIDMTADTKRFPKMERARAYAVNGRPLGLGVFGYHAYLMKNNWAFDSEEATYFNETFFYKFDEETNVASYKLANLLQPAPWANGRRNIQLTAIAPTVGNSVVNDGVSPGIEPLEANYYEASGASGSFKRKNPILKKLLKDKGYDNHGTWEEILANAGSVQGLSSNILSDEEKSIFKTFNEIDQRAIIKAAAARQKYLEQTQSVNLSFDLDASAEYISDVHLMAEQMGLHSLYYLRSESVQKKMLRSKEDVKSSSIINGEISSDYFQIITKNGCIWCEKSIELLTELNKRFGKFTRKDESTFNVPNTYTTYPKIFKNGHFLGGYNELREYLFINGAVSEGPESCSSCDG